MRKFAAYGAAALLTVSALAGGVSYAQSSTATPAPTATQAVTAPMTAQRPWLGVSVKDDTAGVTVTQVDTGSPAESAQLQVGDVILAVNGTNVSTVSDLAKIIDAASAGDKVTLTIERNSAQLSVDVTLGSHADGRMGMFAADPLRAAELAVHAQLTAVTDGYQVTALGLANAFNPNDSSNNANPNADVNANPFNLAVGDVITQVNGTAIASFDWRTLFVPPAASSNSNSTTNASSTVTLTVERGGSSMTLEGTLTMPQMRGGRGGFFGGGPDNGQPNGNGDHGGFPGGQSGGNNGQPNTPPDGGQPGGFI